MRKPPIWIDRVHRIGECPSKTYAAALGTALLAKASDGQVDVLTIKSKAGARAYSMRGVVKVLVEKAPIYGYDLGVAGPEPLNNQPRFGADRVDRTENVHRDNQKCHQEIVRMLSDLNKASEADAARALAAFLRARIAAAASYRAASASLTAARPRGLGELTELLTVFIREDPEGGRRGQALVAALLDLGNEEVSLAAINDPTGIDVAVFDGTRLVLPVEVKQKAVDEDVAIRTAQRAAEGHADKALLVALAREQRPLDRERVRKQARDAHGVVLAIWEGVEELVYEVATRSRSHPRRSQPSCQSCTSVV